MWLDDSHISLAQEILELQFPHIDGLQNTLLSQAGGFSPVKREAIQIHHISGNHWITSSSIGLEIKVYDSKFSGSELSSLLTHQLAEVYKTLKTQELL